MAFISLIISLDAPANLFITILSSIFHEIGHLTMMLITSNKPKKIRFEITGINIIRNNTNISTRNEIIIALGGPLFNGLLLIFGCLILYHNNLESVMLIASVNLILMIFNLLPIQRLDGGLVLYYLLSKKYEMITCNKVIKISSIIFIILIYIWGFYIFVVSNYNFSMIIIAIFLTLSLFNDNDY